MQTPAAAYYKWEKNHTPNASTTNTEIRGENENNFDLMREI